jgi:drug/metabolite transporter (DMT)-like permease
MPSTSTSHRRALLPWIALGVIYIVWGSTYMAIRLVVREVPPMAAAALRFLAAGVVMSFIAAVADRREARPTRRQIVDYAVIGVLLLTAGNGLVMWSETRLPSSIAALIVGTAPLWVTLLDGLRPGGRPWTVRVWVGALVGFAGVALIARPQGTMEPGHWTGILTLQCACICWTIGSLYTQSVTKRLPVLTASAIEMIAGGLALLAVSRVLGEDVGLFRTASNQAWLGIGYLAVFGSLVGFTAFAYCLNELPASTVSTYAYVNPVVAVILGRVFLHEPLPVGLVAGGALVVTGVIVTTRRPAPAIAPPDAAAAEA